MPNYLLYLSMICRLNALSNVLQWHHAAQSQLKGILGEYAKPDDSFKEGGGAETTSNLLQCRHAEISGENLKAALSTET